MSKLLTWATAFIIKTRRASIHLSLYLSQRVLNFPNYFFSFRRILIELHSTNHFAHWLVAQQFIPHTMRLRMIIEHTMPNSPWHAIYGLSNDLYRLDSSKQLLHGATYRRHFFYKFGCTNWVFEWARKA